MMMMLFSTISFAQKKQNFVVVLDAGHGGHDAGARGVADYEKNITLDVTLRFGKMIEKNHPDVKVVYTRKTDVFLELWERTRISNDNHANLFISIHCNSAKNTSAFGSETFVMGLNKIDVTDEVSRRENSVIFLEKDQERYEKFNPNDPEAVIAFEIMNAAYKEQSIRFADLVEKKFVNEQGRKSRGVKQANFHVLRGNAAPSVLVELGFISNQDEGTYLASDEGKQASTESLYKAFKDFKAEFDRRSGIVPEAEKKKNVKVVEKPLEGKTLKIKVLETTIKYSNTSPQLKGLTDVEIVQDGNKYVYYYGNTNLESRAQELLTIVKRKGFDRASIQEFDLNQKLEGQKNYRILFMSSNKKYKDKDDRFVGLTDVLRVKNGGMFNYYYGSEKTMDAADKVLTEVHKKGFRNAFVVTFNGEEPM